MRAALHGQADVLRRMPAFGVEPTTVRARNESHGARAKQYAAIAAYLKEARGCP